MMAPFVVMVVPLSVLGYDKLSTVREDAEPRSDFAAFADLEQARGAIILPAASERIVLIGLAVIDDLGIPRDVAADVAGLDLEQRFAAASLALDAGLENLVTRHGATSSRKVTRSPNGWPRCADSSTTNAASPPRTAASCRR